MIGSKIIRTLLTAVCFLVVLTALGFGDSLKTTASGTTLDGKIVSGEYSYEASFDSNRLKLYLNRTPTTLSVGIMAETSGWVAVGFDSLMMDKAKIFIGYVQGGKISFRSDRGQGHRHGPDGSVDVKGHALFEEAGKTVMEIEFAPGSLIGSGDRSLSLIIGYGGSDSFSSMHRYRTSSRIDLE